MFRMMVEYKRTLKQVQGAKDVAKEVKNEHDATLLSGAESDLRYAINYLELGHAPGPQRGIHRRSYLQREILKDPQDPKFLARVLEQQKAQRDLSPEKKELVDDILAILTSKEREVYVMIKGHGYSYEQAARLLGHKSKGSAQQLMTRAEKKISFVVRKPPSSEETQLQRVMF